LKKEKPPKPFREFYNFGTPRVRIEHVNGSIMAGRRSHLPKEAE
jgi:hypothetical protein